MEVLYDFLINQVGVQGVFFVFTLVLAYIIYKEWKSEKEERKLEKEEAIRRELTLQDELRDNREMLKKFSEKYDLIIERLETLSEQLRRS